jgi:hypothetical protein
MFTKHLPDPNAIANTPKFTIREICSTRIEATRAFSEDHCRGSNYRSLTVYA